PGVFYPPPTPEVGRVALTGSQRGPQGATTGREEAHATSQPAIRNRSADFSPRPSSTWYGRQLACLCAHAYTDTKEEPTMPLLSSKIELPLTLSPRGERGCPPYSYTSTPLPPRSFPRAAAGGGPGAQAGGRWGGHAPGPFGINMPNGLAVSSR